jgi:indolepyruvate ferredoxin oxidoreductase alpha subunit
MHALLEDRRGERKLLLGNEGIARGAIEAGVEVATAYPGTPSSEIADTFYALSQQSDLYFEYSTNEKVALEVASAAAISGMRSICTMKHVGLNVAADPLNTLCYTGVRAGMVIVTADDPSMHSSQNEQDNRYYAKLSLLPMLEPSDPTEAHELTRAAFRLSEALDMPVLLRTTTRVNHTRGVCSFDELTPRRYQGHFEKNFMRWVPVPLVARKLRPKLLDKQAEAFEAMKKLGFDRIEGSGEIGIITSGVAYAYVREVLEELGIDDRTQVLKITSIHPLPRHLIEKSLRSTKEILIVEELEPYLETEVKAIAHEIDADPIIRGKGADWIPRHFELSGDRIRQAVARLHGIPIEAPIRPDIPQDLPPRPPMLCAGCTHRTTYYAVKSVADRFETYYASDIGCYTLGLLPPLSTTDSFLCMGSSVTMATGASINNAQKHVAFIGDSTFYHSGITGLVNAVHNRHDLLLVILDNSTTAMTGHQPHPSSELVPEKQRGVDIVQLIKGCGVPDVHVVDPEDLKTTIRTVQEAYDRPGVRVIISRHPCPLFNRRIAKQKGTGLVYRVDPDRCKFCGKLGDHEGCSIPIDKDDEILRARTKIANAACDPYSFPAKGRARKHAPAPCTYTCPANICVTGYMALARAGKYDEALALIRESVPLPMILGRVCHRPCEDTCVRADYDEAVSINGVKRFLAEHETPEQRAAFCATMRDRAIKARDRTGGKRIAVIGAGPAGLAAAWDLNQRGYNATIFDRERLAGGMLVAGLPEHRMPRELVRTEVEALLSTGIEFRPRQTLGRDFTVRSLLDEQGFDAVCVAIGAHRGIRLGVPGDDAAGVEEALSFLHEVNLEGRTDCGSNVVVIGGGDAASDAARVALRLGADHSSILYRRSADEMPMDAEELRETIDEGVEIRYLVQPVEIITENGRVVGVNCVRNELGEPDESGRRRPVPIEGSEFIIDCDHVIAAIGQTQTTEALDNDIDLGRDHKGALRVDPDRGAGATADPRVFAAGDCTGEGWTVIDAIAQGRRAALGIDAFLSEGADVEPLVLHTPDEIAADQRYHPEDVELNGRAIGGERPGKERRHDFNEFSYGLTEQQVLHEAERCLSCGQCARCNNCIDNFGCPAIYKMDGRVHIDEVLCTGCGVCAQLCPNDAIVPIEA